MSIRSARYQDLDRVADILTAAFWDGDIVGRFMHPYRARYPGDFREWWKRRLRAIWWEPKYALLVSTSEDGTINGFSKWKAHGTSAEKRRLWVLDPRNVMKPMAKFFNTLSSLIWPVRSVDPTAIRYFEQAAPFYKGHWTGSRSNRWELESLAVHPDCQGHGYGKLLATWGLDQAREEKVSAGVVSAKGKENFYLKCGFDNPGIIGSICEGEGNPLNGRIEGGTILFKDVV